jgi:hypothetical protein
MHGIAGPSATPRVALPTALGEHDAGAPRVDLNADELLEAARG